jgi:hypothetical protein
MNKLISAVKSTDISGMALSERISINLKHLQGSGAV